ncbi:hypothetical protein [Pseudovibrio denitrificans]|nr:hypothetical protein [Pseudovibrio denitrificans]
MGAFILEVEINARLGEFGNVQLDQMCISRAIVIRLNVFDGLQRPRPA